MTNKERYRKFCTTHPVVPVFSNPHWLDAVAENWDVCLAYDEHKRLVAALPYCWKGNFFTKRIYLPDVSFYQSVLFFNDDDISKKKKLTDVLIKQLPIVVKSYFKLLPKHIDINLSKSGFVKEEYTTYIISRKQEINLNSNHKRNIQKGNKLNYDIRESKDTEQSYAMLASTFIRQKLKCKLTLADFIKLNALAKKNKCGSTLDCYDEHKNLLASLFIAEDEATVYYLFGGYNTEYKNSGAMTYLLFHVMQDAQQRQLDFNFCGSSKKSIAAYFEGFSAQKNPVPIWKKSIL